MSLAAAGYGQLAATIPSALILVFSLVLEFLREDEGEEKEEAVWPRPRCENLDL